MTNSTTPNTKQVKPISLNKSDGDVKQVKDIDVRHKQALTRNQHMRFNILVPFYSDMDIKRQREKGSLTKESAHPIYNEAIEKLEQLLTDTVKAEVNKALDKVAEMNDRGMFIDGKKTPSQLLQEHREKVSSAIDQVRNEVI